MFDWVLKLQQDLNHADKLKIDKTRLFVVLADSRIPLYHRFPNHPQISLWIKLSSNTIAKRAVSCVTENMFEHAFLLGRGIKFVIV